MTLSQDGISLLPSAEMHLGYTKVTDPNYIVQSTA